MAVTISLSDTFTLDRSAAVLINTNLTLAAGTLYVTAPSDASDYTLTLPMAIDGDTILIKRLGTGTLTLERGSTPIDGSTPSTPVTITTNQPVRLTYHSTTIGWVIL